MKVGATILGAGGPLVLWFKYQLQRRDQDYKQKLADAGISRQSRADEVEVLHRQLDRLHEDIDSAKDEARAEREKLWLELANLRITKDKEVSDLKSLLSAALIENGRLVEKEKALMDRNRELLRTVKGLEERVAKLEDEADRLRKATP